MPYDVDGDHNDELLFWNRKSLLAVRPESPEQPLWERAIPTRLDAELVGILKGTPGIAASAAQTSVAVVRLGSGDNSLIGVDTHTGDVRWTCAGPAPRRGSGWNVLDRLELLGAEGGQATQVMYEFGDVSACRQVAFASDRLGTSPTNGPPETDTREILQHIPESVRTRPALSPAESDPRRLRDLPWRVRLKDPDARDITPYGKWTPIYCLTLILFPGAMLRTLVRRRKFDWLAAIGALAVCAVLLIGMTIGDIDDESPWKIGRLLLALAGLPPVYFLGELIGQAQHGRWRRALLWVIVFVAITATLAQSSSDSRRTTTAARGRTRATSGRLPDGDPTAPHRGPITRRVRTPHGPRRRRRSYAVSAHCRSCARRSIRRRTA